MNPPEPKSDGPAIREMAARWTVRRDRGLSAAESIEFELWLSADERHAEALRSSADVWSRLDRVPEGAAATVLAAATRRRSFWRWTVAVSSLAAAALVLVAVRNWHGPAGDPVMAPAAAEPRQLTLSDGTVVQLNTGGEVVEEFTPGERRVQLVRGEAHFSVTKNPARPFVVRAGNLEVRAVGTAFNVQLESAAVEVLVTEGVVRLKSEATPDGGSTDAIPLLNAGHRAVVALAPASPATAVVVTAVSADEISRSLAWQEPLLRFGGATLAEVAASFERRTGRRMTLADPGLATVRFGGRFRADDIDGFANLLAATLDIDVVRAADGALVLRKKNPTSR